MWAPPISGEGCDAVAILPLVLYSRSHDTSCCKMNARHPGFPRARSAYISCKSVGNGRGGFWRAATLLLVCYAVFARRRSRSSSRRNMRFAAERAFHQLPVAIGSLSASDPLRAYCRCLSLRLDNTICSLPGGLQDGLGVSSCPVKPSYAQDYRKQVPCKNPVVQWLYDSSEP